MLRFDRSYVLEDCLLRVEAVAQTILQRLTIDFEVYVTPFTFTERKTRDLSLPYVLT